MSNENTENWVNKGGYTHLDDLAIQLDSANLEVDTNGRDVAVSVRIVGETKQQARLADTGIADQQKLKSQTVGESNHDKVGDIRKTK